MLFCFVLTSSQCVVLYLPVVNLPVVSVLFCFVFTSSQCVVLFCTKLTTVVGVLLVLYLPVQNLPVVSVLLCCFVLTSSQCVGNTKLPVVCVVLFCTYQ